MFSTRNIGDFRLFSGEIASDAASGLAVNKAYVDALVAELKAVISANSIPLLSYVWSDYDFSSTNPNWVVSDSSSKLSTSYPKAWEHLVADISGKEITNETVESENTSGVSYSVYCYTADDGHKIVPATYNGIDQLSVLNSMYNDNGSAWYYCLDVESGNFVLPRMSGAERRILPKDSVVPVYGNGMTLGMTDGTISGGFADNYIAYCVWRGSYGTSVGTDPSGSTFTGKTYGITKDKEMSGIVADVIDSCKTVSDQRKTYLVFFVA